MQTRIQAVSNPLPLAKGRAEWGFHVPDWATEATSPPQEPPPANLGGNRIGGGAHGDQD